MHHLPLLRAGDSSWRLPLSEHVAAMFGELLLAEEDSRLELLTELLAAEPLVTLWAVSCSRHWWTKPPSGLREIAIWLADCLAARLAGVAVGDTKSCPDETRVSELSARAVRAGREAFQVCNQRGGARVSADLATCLGVLCTARELLSNCGDAVSWEQLCAGDTCVPPSIAILLHEVERLRQPTAAAGPQLDVAAETSEALHAAAEAGSREETAPTVDVNPSSESAWRRLLPALARKLHRLEVLDNEFEGRLEQEKILALKSLAYGASHELNNPLANIATRAQTLLGDEPDPERRRKLATINSQAFRAHEMISDMMLFAQPPQLDRQSHDLSELARTALEELAGDAESQGTALSCRTVGEGPQAQVDRTQLLVALKAVCVNALEALRGGGAIEVRVETLTERGETWRAISVIDSGPGIPPEIRRHLFDPYFSGREAGRGLGLGLSKCWTIIHGHGGKIVMDEVAPQGTLVQLLLPSVVPSEDRQAGRQVQPNSEGAGKFE